MKSSFKTGAIALAFLVLGFELAMFVHRAAVERDQLIGAFPVGVSVAPKVPCGSRSTDIAAKRLRPDLRRAL